MVFLSIEGDIVFRLTFRNSRDEPQHIQVDPWACLYILNKDEELVIEAEPFVDLPTISMEEIEGTTIVTLPHCEDFFVIVDGKRTFWRDFQSNC